MSTPHGWTDPGDATRRIEAHSFRGARQAKVAVPHGSGPEIDRGSNARPDRAARLRMPQRGASARRKYTGCGHEEGRGRRSYDPAGGAGPVQHEPCRISGLIRALRAIFDYVDPTPLSCPAEAGHPVCTASAVEILSPRTRRTAHPMVTGSSAFADDDIMWRANVIEKRSNN